MVRSLLYSRLRASKNGHRQLINEDELIDAVRKLGFKIVEPEFLPFEEQIKIFSNAEILVGLGGAGMFNCVFSGQNSMIVDIESSNGWVNAHANLFQSSLLNYAVVFGKEDLTDNKKSHRRWSLDVDSFLSFLTRIISDHNHSI